MNELPNRPHLFPSEVQKFLRISRATLYRMLKKRAFPAVRIGNSYRIPREQFTVWYGVHLDELNAGLVQRSRK